MARIKSKMPCRLIAIKLIEDETTGVASKLNIIKICSRPQSKLIDQALMQTSINMSQKSVTAFRLNKRSTRGKEQQPFLPDVGVPPPPLPPLANIGKKKVGR